MKLGAALAAMQRGIGMVHQRWPQRFENGKWVFDEAGGVEVVPMRNPLEATGLLLEGQAVALFNRRDYAAAALVLEDVVGKVRGVEREHYYRGLLLLARGYAAWDVADYDGALQNLKAAREELDVDFGEPALSERAVQLLERVRANLRFLGRVRGKLSVEKVVDMVENARRRITDQGRYDDGVARLYRAVEMWHQWRLFERHSLSTDDVDWEKVPQDARGRFLAQTGLAQVPGQLGLLWARALDRVLGGEVPEEDKVFRDLLQQRNASILAHGLRPVGETSAKRFLSHVDEMVNEAQIRDQATHARLAGL